MQGNHSTGLLQLQTFLNAMSPDTRRDLGDFLRRVWEAMTPCEACGVPISPFYRFRTRCGASNLFWSEEVFHELHDRTLEEECRTECGNGHPDAREERKLFPEKMEDYCFLCGDQLFF